MFFDLPKNLSLLRTPIIILANEGIGLRVQCPTYRALIALTGRGGFPSITGAPKTPDLARKHSNATQDFGGRLSIDEVKTYGMLQTHGAISTFYLDDFCNSFDRRCFPRSDTRASAQNQNRLFEP